MYVYFMFKLGFLSSFLLSYCGSPVLADFSLGVENNTLENTRFFLSLSYFRFLLSCTYCTNGVTLFFLLLCVLLDITYLNSSCIY